MVVDQDHDIDEVFHEPGDHELTLDRFDTPYVLVAARTLVDPADVATVNALQDQIRLTAASRRPFEPPEYDVAGLDATRAALLELSKGIGGWNSIVRLHRPRPEILDGSRTFPPHHLTSARPAGSSAP